MAEPTSTPTTSVELAARLSELEGQLRQSQVLRGRIGLVSLFGLLLLLMVLLHFAYRIVDHVWELRRIAADPVQSKVLVGEFWKEAGISSALEGDAWAFRSDLNDKVPDFGHKLLTAMEAKMPELDQRSSAMGGRLQSRVEQHVEQQLAEAMAQAFKTNAADLQLAAPGLTPAVLAQQLPAARAAYLERLHPILEDKLAYLEPSFAILHGPAHEAADREVVSPQAVDELQHHLVDTMIELVVYELKPSRGKQVLGTEPKTGAAKGDTVAAPVAAPPAPHATPSAGGTP